LFFFLSFFLSWVSKTQPWFLVFWFLVQPNSVQFSSISYSIQFSSITQFSSVQFIPIFFKVCVLLCFVDPILGNLTVRGHSFRHGTWGCRILTLHLNYVAGYTSPLLFLFERTHNYFVDNQGLLPWRLRRLGRSKVRSVSLVRVLSDGKISWAWGPKVCVILHLPRLKQSNTCSFEKREKKNRRRDTRVGRI